MNSDGLGESFRAFAEGDDTSPGCDEWYQVIIESLEDYAIFLLDPEGRISSWNTGAQLLFGYGKEEILGQSVNTLFTEADIDKGVPEEKIDSARREGRATDEGWHPRKDGSLFWGSGILTSIYDDKGKVMAFIKVLRDKTNLRQTHEELEMLLKERARDFREQKERLSTLLDASPQIVYATDEKGRINESSPSWESFSGQSYKEYADRGYLNAVHPEDRKQLEDEWDYAKETHSPFDVEARFYHGESRSFRWMRVRGVPRFDKDNGLLGWININIDIDERRRAWKQVHHLVFALTQAEERERRRIGSILHDDLQQQVFGAEMATRRVIRHVNAKLDDNVAEPLVEMLSEISQVHDSVIDTARNLSRDLSPLILKEQDFGELLRWLAEHMHDRHELTVELDVEDAPIIEQRDLRAILFRFVRELLFNVVKHSGTLEAQVQAETQNGWLIVQVQDDGVGFDVSTLGASEGYGLSNMKERLRLLDGRLVLDTDIGEGVSATLYLKDSFGEPE